MDEVNPKKLIYCDVLSDKLLIDDVFSVPYHPCQVTLTQSILAIKIHQATGAGATECHIPQCEWQHLMPGSPAWCWAKTLVRHVSGSWCQSTASKYLAPKNFLTSSIIVWLLKCVPQPNVFSSVERSLTLCLWPCSFYGWCSSDSWTLKLLCV